MNNALDVILMSILDMIGIETQETRDIKSGKKAIENTKGNRLSPSEQKFKTGGQTEMFNKRGQLRNFRSPAQSATRPPSTSPVPTRSRLQATPPNRPSGGFGQAPGQGQLGGEVPRNMRLRAPTVPPKMGRPTAAGPQPKPPIRGESYQDLKAKPKPKAPGVKPSTPKPSGAKTTSVKPTVARGPSTPLSKAPNAFTRGLTVNKLSLATMALAVFGELLRRAPGPTGRAVNEGLEDMEGRYEQRDQMALGAGVKLLEALGLVDEGYFDEPPEAPELPDSEGITMPEIETQPMNPQEGSEAQREDYWNQVPLTPVVPPRNPSQAPVRATREQLRPAQVDQTMPNMGYETVSPNRGQLAPNPFSGR
jgi:hypothetical protein